MSWAFGFQTLDPDCDCDLWLWQVREDDALMPQAQLLLVIQQSRAKHSFKLVSDVVQTDYNKQQDWAFSYAPIGVMAYQQMSCSQSQNIDTLYSPG